MNKLKSFYIPFVLSIAAAGLHGQTVSADKPSLTWSTQAGGPAAQQIVNVTSAPGGASFNAHITEQTSTQIQWLRFFNSTTPQDTTATTPAQLTLVADPTGLAAGIYQATLLLYNNSGSVQIPVTFNVSVLGVTPGSLALTYQTGGAVPGAQNLVLSGPNTTYNASASTSGGGNWLQVTPAGGSIAGSGTVTVLLDPAVVPNLAAGSYNGAVTITPTGAGNNTPLVVPVSLTVTVPPPVTVSSKNIQLNYQLGGANNQPQQVLTLSTTSAQPVPYLAVFAANNNPSGRSFVLVNPSSGMIPANGSTQLTVSYDNTAALPVGTWGGTLTVYTSSASPAQQNVNVSLLVSNSPLLSVPSAGLTFTYELNSGATPAAQSVVAASTNAAPGAATGQIAVSATAATASGGSWLSVAPASGLTGTASPFSVSVNPAGLATGTYSGTVAFSGANTGNGPQTLPVTLVVANDPAISANWTSLTFAQQIGQPAVASSQNSQTLVAVSSTGGPLNYTATASTTPAGGSWLAVSGNSSGTSNATFTVSVLPAGLTAGTYTGAITITATNPATGNQAINSPLTIPVTFYLSSAPVLVVTMAGNPPSQPVLTAQVNGQAPATLPVTLNSSNPAVPLNYTVTFSTASGGNWLYALPQSGTTAPGSNVVQIGALPGILSPGFYSGTVTIAATAGGTAVADSPYTIPVSFVITSGSLSLNSTQLQFTQTAGGAAPATQPVQVSGNGQSLNFQAASDASWLSVTPAGGTSLANGTLTVSVDGSKLSPGTYTGHITVTSPNATGSPAVVTVTLTVSAGRIQANQTPLTFSQPQNGPAPAAQSISVTGSPASLNFAVTASTATGGNWLTAAVGSGGTSGATPGTVQVSVNGATLAQGQYNGTVTIASAGATGSPLAIPVVLNVVPPQTLTVTPTAPLSFNYNLGAPAPQALQLQLTSSGSTTYTAAAATKDGANWLSVTPPSGNAGTTATPLSVAVNPSGLAAGNYTGTITIASPNSSTPVAVNVNLTVSAIPPPSIIGIRNAASGATGSIAPGENIAIYGTGVGPAQLATLQLTSSGKLANLLAGVQVLFDGTVAAPIIYTSANQTSVMVPYEIAGRATTNITLVYQGVTSAPLTYNVAQIQPGVYTQNLSGTGPGAIVNQDYSINGPGHPAAAGSTVAVYMTGEGMTGPQAITGGVAPLDGTGLETPQAPVTATIGGVPAQVTYKGSAPGFVYGAAQVNLVIPVGVPSGPQPVVITVGGVPTQSGVTVQVQ